MEYHDCELVRPVYDDNKLFDQFCLFRLADSDEKQPLSAAIWLRSSFFRPHGSSNRSGRKTRPRTAGSCALTAVLI